MNEQLRTLTSEKWEQGAKWPLSIAALIFLAAYAWPILDPALAPFWVTLCTVAAWGTWALFAFDYLVRLVLTNQRQTFVRHNIVDLAVIALPILRPLRLLRLFTVLNFLNRTASTAFRSRVIVYMAGATILLVFVAGLAILDAERGRPGSNINNYGDGLWWATTTITTVGYGDRFPVTAMGRLVALGLMVAGIAIAGIITAVLASWIVQRVTETEENQQAVTRTQVQDLTEQIQALRADLQAVLHQQPTVVADSSTHVSDVHRTGTDTQATS